MTDKQITHTCDATDCEQYYPEHTCCHCRNAEWYGLKEQLKAKEQECEELKKELHKNFEEKDTLHLIIDRLLEASGYDTNTASAEDFEDVYEHMRYEQQQLDQLKQQLEAYKMKAEEGKEINAELKAENDELKEKNRQLTILGMDLNQSNEVLRKSFFATDKSRDYWREHIRKLKQTLTEIKEIINDFAKQDIITFPDFEPKRNYDFIQKQCGEPIIQILQKISECEVEDEHR